MHLRSLFGKRPSAAMVVAMIALFAAMAGAGYAAVSLPSNSVGNKQLKNGSVGSAKLKNASVGQLKLKANAVTYKAIKPGTIGSKRVNEGQIQARVTGDCTTGAITSVGKTGKVTCAATPGTLYDTTTPSAQTVGTSSTQIAKLSLPGAQAFLLTANPSIVVQGVTPTGTTGATGATGATGTTGVVGDANNETVVVTCTLAGGASASATETRSIIVDLGPNTQEQSLAMSVAVPAAPNAITAALSCTKSNTGSPSPTVSVQSDVNALQVAAATAQPYAG